MDDCEQVLDVVKFNVERGELGINVGIIFINMDEIGIHVTPVEVQIFVIVVIFSINFDIEVQNVFRLMQTSGKVNNLI